MKRLKKRNARMSVQAYACSCSCPGSNPDICTAICGDPSTPAVISGAQMGVAELNNSYFAGYR